MDKSKYLISIPLPWASKILGVHNESNVLINLIKDKFETNTMSNARTMQKVKRTIITSFDKKSMKKEKQFNTSYIP